MILMDTNVALPAAMEPILSVRIYPTFSENHSNSSHESRSHLSKASARIF